MSSHPLDRQSPSTAEVDAARVLLSRLGVTAEDLLGAPVARSAAPTFRDYIPVVAAGARPGTRRVYSSYWKRIDKHWGERRIDEPTSSQIRQFLVEMQSELVIRSGRGGHSAAEHLIAALRCLYRHAEEGGLITPVGNPAKKVDKPRRPPSTRRAVADTRLAEIVQMAATTGDDPALDALILRLHIETACRSGGALALRPIDLDPDHCLISLREKGDTTRSQPVSPTLMSRLLAHAKERTADTSPSGPLLRYRSGQRITRRRYDHIWTRIGRHLPWVATQGIGTHWLRHTTLTWVERNFSYAVARAYAGHNDRVPSRTAQVALCLACAEIATELVIAAENREDLRVTDPDQARRPRPRPSRRARLPHRPGHTGGLTSRDRPTRAPRQVSAPPSTRNCEPVTNDEASEARNSTMSAISAGSPTRPSGTPDSMVARVASTSPPSSVSIASVERSSWVLIMPGCTELTRTWYAADSMAVRRVMPVMANFEVT
jgi:integrase/recombinase XerC